MSSTKIEWTDATWNPVRGCSIVSEGCRNCYAMKQAHRFSGPGRAYEGLTKLTSSGPVWNGTVRTVASALDQPLRWRKPRRVFVNSMSDLFHEGVPDDFINSVLCTIALAKQHTFQVLTKRPERMRDYFLTLPGFKRQTSEGCSQVPYRPIANLWLGVSVEDQRTADERVPILRETPAAVRFVSAEPLLGDVSLDWTPRDGSSGIDWVIVGGESGHNARPVNPEWIRHLRDQCFGYGASFFFKQWGEWLPFKNDYAGFEWVDEQPDGGIYLNAARVDGKRYEGRQVQCDPDDEISYVRVGKKAAGRQIDGHTWDQYPEGA